MTLKFLGETPTCRIEAVKEAMKESLEKEASVKFRLESLGVFGSSYADSFAHRPNGLTNFIRSYGLIYFISFFLIMHLSLKKFFKSINSVGYSKNSLLFIGIIFIMGFSQLVVHTIFTMCLLFWGLNTKSVKDTL